MMLQVRQMLIEVLTGFLPLTAAALALAMAFSTPAPEAPQDGNGSDIQEQADALEVSTLPPMPSQVQQLP